MQLEELKAQNKIEEIIISNRLLDNNENEHLQFTQEKLMVVYVSF